jgi:hypothetical protein
VSLVTTDGESDDIDDGDGESDDGDEDGLYGLCWLVRECHRVMMMDG